MVIGTDYIGSCKLIVMSICVIPIILIFGFYFYVQVEVCVFGPYDHWGKKKYVLVFLDLYSMWPEVMVVDTLSPTIVTMSLLNLVCRYCISLIS